MDIFISLMAGLIVGVITRLMFPNGKTVSIVSGDIVAMAIGTLVAAVVFSLLSSGTQSGPIWLTIVIGVAMVGILFTAFRIIQRIFATRTR